MNQLRDRSTTELTMIRTFQASAEAVFDAFLKPELMIKWFLTREDTNQVVKNDPRVGGTWEVVDRRDGVTYRAIGRYLEIDRPNRLVFTFEMPQFNDAVDTVTVMLKPLEKGCEMTFTHLMTIPHEEGWTEREVQKAISEGKEDLRCGWELMFEILRAIPHRRK